MRWAIATGAAAALCLGGLFLANRKLASQQQDVTRPMEYPKPVLKADFPLPSRFNLTRICVSLVSRFTSAVRMAGFGRRAWKIMPESFGG